MKENRVWGGVLEYWHEVLGCAKRIYSLNCERILTEEGGEGRNGWREIKKEAQKHNDLAGQRPSPSGVFQLCQIVQTGAL